LLLGLLMLMLSVAAGLRSAGSNDEAISWLCAQSHCTPVQGERCLRR
jgi:hypothetical protein